MTFKNVPLTDFTIADNRDSFRRALEAIDEEIKAKALDVSPFYHSMAFEGTQHLESRDPSSPDIIVGKVNLTTKQEALTVIEGLKQYAPIWEATPYQERSELLRKAAQAMDAQRMRLSAIIVREAGKPWKEADADVVEAIDFCNYYAAQMDELGPARMTQKVLGEDNRYFYQARGVAVIISPWNFPLAIACGMLTAALVTGNTAVLKPAEQTSIIAAELCKLLYEIGIPEQALAFLPGIGEEVGAALVDSPDTDIICFTGSKPVGLSIIRSAAEVRPGQRSIKKVIAELGGKNAIIVDEDADLDEAIKGVLYSSFGFAGQKCSACSRVIIIGDAYETFLERFGQAASDIIIDLAKNPASYLGPVIDKEAYDRIMGRIQEGERDLKLLFKGEAPAHGYFIPPTIFRDVPTDSALWKEEIFGPVVCCRPAKDISEAIRLAVDSQYALTGGLFSRSPAHIEQAMREFRVGNLYINRSCTGAIVCRQPFGGFAMSGIGSKAGGPDYLLQFLEPRTVTENTMRRGFTPDQL
ncbi:MAG: L-glutamate gamma-semialdehyde dehydrogenase [Bdellovibrionales bacterium]|nr:L-glutamate gamma-semialdehyde dehydrogenase [Bdellovibrionales bacterium]